MMKNFFLLVGITCLIFSCSDKQKGIGDNMSVDSLANFEINGYNKKGVNFQYSGMHDSAVFYFNKAIQKSLQQKNRTLLPEIYTNLAEAYDMTGDYPKAAGAYRQALLLADSLQYEESLKYPVYSGLGHIYINLKNFPMADYYLNLAESHFDSMLPINQQYLAVTRVNYYYNTKEYRDAIPWLRKADQIVKTMDSPFSQAVVDSNFGEIYLLLNQPDSAQFYLDKAAEFFLKPEMGASAAFYVNGLYASLYLQRDDLKSAERILLQSVDSTMITPVYLYYNDKRLEELYHKKGDYKKAYEYHLKTDVYDVVQRNIAAQNNIAEIDSRYRQDTTVMKRDVLIAQKEQKVQKFRNVSLVLILAIVLIALAVIFIVIYNRRKNELRHSRQMSAMTKLRMENVRNRVSPHFILNVLNSIVPGMREHKNLNRSVQLLMQSIRNSLLISEEPAISLEEEIGIVKNYVELRKTIDPDIPELQWNIAPGIDLNTMLPSMILQIPIENSLKYAFNPDDTGKQILIDIAQKNDTIFIVIEDNGIGFNPSRQQVSAQGTGTGLKILYRTIELLNEKNYRKIRFSIQNQADIDANRHGTKVSIEIPVDFHYDKF